MIAPEAALAESARGYPFACCSCVKLHQARALGHKDGCMALLRGENCGSPLRGNDFPLYEGPLGNPFPVGICFVCGKPSEELVRTKRKPLAKPVGVCGAHRGMFKADEERADGQVLRS